MLVTTGFPSFCSSGSMISSVRKLEQLMKMAWAYGRSTSATRPAFCSGVKLACAWVPNPLMASTSKSQAFR